MWPMTYSQEELRNIRTTQAKRKNDLRRAAKILKGADKDLVAELINEYERQLKEQN